MCGPEMTLYTPFAQVIYALFGPVHTASLRAITALVWALLIAQSLHPSDMGRALPELKTVRARQAFRRVRRILRRTLLSSKYLTPMLIKAALRLVPDKEVFLVLDSTRCIRWEIFTLGIKLGGRVLPIAWSILPYPWPKKLFTPTVVALLNRTLTYWPEERAVHLLADRGFPSLKLFRELEDWRRRLPMGYTVRLRAGDWVRMEQGNAVSVGQLMASVVHGDWSAWHASYQHRRKAGPLALLVIGRGIPLYPAHQMGPADQARRLAREQRRVAHLLSKGQPNAPDTDRAWALLSTAGDCVQAKERYALRFSTEGTYRDWKSWYLEAVSAHESDSEHLDGLVGLAALGYFVQAAIGVMAGRADGDDAARARQQQWSTTDRLSIFWRGRQVLHDHAYDWRAWLSAKLPELARQISQVPPPSKRARGQSGRMATKEAA